MTTLRRLHSGWRRVRGSAVRIGTSQYEVNLKDNGFRWRKKKESLEGGSLFYEVECVPRFCGLRRCLFSVDDGFVNGIPTGCGDTPVVGGVLVYIDSDLASFCFFVGIDTHDSNIFYCLTS